ncbi:MAG: dephospho-CoA kinase [Candidatus Caenarcaniphilales bacterium]|nr:dephospho-CoA kinase [Candidatus Caenarcaniphilales bacterium]
MLKIAVTGNIACGKSFAGQLLKEYGLPVLDCDHVVHELLLQNNQITSELIEILKPNDILNNNSSESTVIDRRKLGKIIFNDNALRRKVEELVHPKCFETIDAFFDKQKALGEKIAFNLIPLLFETNSQNRYDQIWLMYCNENVQYERFKIRNPELDIEDIENRIKSQISQEKKKELSDFIIDNSGSKENTEQQLRKILNGFGIIK